MDDKRNGRQWAIGASQRNSDQDRFLAGLDIAEWDVADFVSLLQEKTTEPSWSTPDVDFMKWLTAKSIEWHQQLYALLFRELSATYGFRRLTESQIIRLSVFVGTEFCQDTRLIAYCFSDYGPAGEFCKTLVREAENAARVERGVPPVRTRRPRVAGA